MAAPESGRSAIRFAVTVAAAPAGIGNVRASKSILLTKTRRSKRDARSFSPCFLLGPFKGKFNGFSMFSNRVSDFLHPARPTRTPASSRARFRRRGQWGLAFAAAVSVAGWADAVQVQRNLPVPMRDGVVLRANVYRPDTSGPHPVLLIRTPYGKDGLKPEKYAEAGYIVVTQDARGRFASDGHFESFYRFDTHDAEDGFDTVEWAAKLPGSTGKVGTFGSSYNAFLQWRLAPLRPPALVTMAASSIPARLTELEGPGTWRPARRLHWWFCTMSPDMLRRSGAPGPHTSAAAAKLWREGEAKKLLDFRPWLELPDNVCADETEAMQAWLRRPHLDPWKLDEKAGEIAVPNLDIVGWFDHCNGVFDLYRAMVREGRTEVARKGQRLIVGPWNHARRGVPKQGEIDFGPSAALDIAQTEIRWFDHWLKGLDNGVDRDAPVRIFVMGANVWRDEAAWPPARAQPQVLFLDSGGKANTPAGDGRLVGRAPVAAAVDHYRYDPRDPVPTLWGSSSFTVPADQRPLAERRDILVYQTPPLESALEVTGDPEAVLYAASVAPDTDFFVRLIDVAPDGSSMDVASGMVRARYRDGLDKPALLKPGAVTEFRIRLRPTANEFRKGHRIRLDVTSSDFPNYDRNHNTAADQNADAQLEIAEQTVHHGGQHRSRLILPVISKASQGPTPPSDAPKKT
jgi:uncharacterized protein